MRYTFILLLELNMASESHSIDASTSAREDFTPVWEGMNISETLHYGKNPEDDQLFMAEVYGYWMYQVSTKIQLYYLPCVIAIGIVGKRLININVNCILNNNM